MRFIHLADVHLGAKPSNHIPGAPEEDRRSGIHFVR